MNDWPQGWYRDETARPAPRDGRGRLVWRADG